MGSARCIVDGLVDHGVCGLENSHITITIGEKVVIPWGNPHPAPFGCGDHRGPPGLGWCNGIGFSRPSLLVMLCIKERLQYTIPGNPSVKGSCVIKRNDFPQAALVLRLSV